MVLAARQAWLPGMVSSAMAARCPGGQESKHTLLGLHAGWHLVGVVKECGILDLLLPLLLAPVEAHIEVSGGVAKPAANAQAYRQPLMAKQQVLWPACSCAMTGILASSAS